MNEGNRVAIYCRLSKDDEQTGDSVSIETQKILLTNYCINQNFEIIEIYVDDGYSGLNFNRPSFRKLINDLENGKFDIVITKDLSRLGRDYIQTGYYIDFYFSTKHIRYIAVNDGIDTLSDNNDIAPFKNILNDMYAKDLSRKVKSAKHQRAKNGLYISAQPPYGYKVDPYNRNKLIVDPEAAPTVKLIFELAYSGKNYSEISRTLEKEKIITPSAYKTLHGDTRFLKYTSKENIYKWSYQTIRNILSNRIYVGDMVNHKVEIINYKTKERVQVPVEKQIIVPNTHEAIVKREIFEDINKLSFYRRKPNHSYENIFKGLVFCAECGEEMQLIAKKLKKETKPMFRCPKHNTDSLICTHNHFIYYENLLEEINRQLYIQVSKFINSSLYDELCESILMNIYIQAQEIKKNKFQKELQALNKNIKNKYKSLSTNINIDELDNLYKTQKILIQNISNNSINSHVLSEKEINDFKLVIKEYLKQIPTDHNVLKLFIEKIEIGHLEKNSLSESIQKINIYYRFNKLLDNLETNT